MAPARATARSGAALRDLRATRSAPRSSTGTARHSRSAPAAATSTGAAARARSAGPEIDTTPRRRSATRAAAASTSSAASIDTRRTVRTRCARRRRCRSVGTRRASLRAAVTVANAGGASDAHHDDDDPGPRHRARRRDLAERQARRRPPRRRPPPPRRRPPRRRRAGRRRGRAPCAVPLTGGARGGRPRPGAPARRRHASPASTTVACDHVAATRARACVSTRSSRDVTARPGPGRQHELRRRLQRRDLRGEGAGSRVVQRLRVHREPERAGHAVRLERGAGRGERRRGQQPAHDGRRRVALPHHPRPQDLRPRRPHGVVRVLRVEHAGDQHGDDRAVGLHGLEGVTGTDAEDPSHLVGQRELHGAVRPGLGRARSPRASARAGSCPAHR